MAGEIVTVCLDGVDGRDYKEALTIALARFGENSDDPRWESPWRVIGGDDGLPLPADRMSDARVLMVDGQYAGAPRGLLDLDGAWATAAAEAGRRWDAWQEFCAAYPKARSLEDFTPNRPPIRRVTTRIEQQQIIRPSRWWSRHLSVRTGDSPLRNLRRWSAIQSAGSA